MAKADKESHGLTKGRITGLILICALIVIIISIRSGIFASTKSANVNVPAASTSINASTSSISSTTTASISSSLSTTLLSSTTTTTINYTSLLNYTSGEDTSFPQPDAYLKSGYELYICSGASFGNVASFSWHQDSGYPNHASIGTSTGPNCSFYPGQSIYSSRYVSGAAAGIGINSNNYTYANIPSGTSHYPLNISPGMTLVAFAGSAYVSYYPNIYFDRGAVNCSIAAAAYTPLNVPPPVQFANSTSTTFTLNLAEIVMCYASAPTSIYVNSTYLYNSTVEVYELSPN